MPQSKSISPGKGGKPYGKRSKYLVYNMVRPNRTYYSLQNYKQNFQNCLPQNYAKFAHFVNLFYIMFQAPAPAENPAEFQRITQIPRDSPTQPANYVNSAHLALKFKYM